MNRKFVKHLLSFFIVVAGIFIFRLAFAQDFGTDAVNTGLGGALPADDPRTIVGRIINVGLGFLGVIAVGLIIYAGFLWMTSAGEEDKISQAKKLLTSAVIGLGIVLASWAIATFIITRLSGAISGTDPNVLCTDGEVASCRCGGSMACSGGAWGGCVGGDCGGCEGNSCPTSCDSSAQGGCQAADQICAAGDYCDTNCTCKPKGEAGTSCDSDASTPTCDADNNLCGNFLSCDSNTCTCIGTPVITDVSPAGGFCEDNNNKSCTQDSDCGTTCNLITPNGAPNNFITISGNNFGAYSTSTSRVVFMGGNRNGRNPSEINPVCVNFWQNDQIIVAVPSGVTTGPIKVIGSDNAEDTTDNDYGPRIPDFISNSISRPGLCSISPNKGALSSSVSYQGINLYSGQAYFGNYQANVQGFDSNFSHPSGLSGTAATPNIRSGNSGSFVINNISGNSEKSNFLKFVKEANPNDGPYIVSFSPAKGKAGQYVTITGNGFGWSKGSAHVYFGDLEASYDFPPVCASSVWGDKQIIIKVPDDIQNGNHLLRIILGGKTIDTQKLNPNVFQADDSLALKTSLCKIEPNQGAVSTPVKVYGEYFGQANREGLVQFSPERSVAGEIKKENRADVISVAVPTSTITGPVKVVKNSEWGNELNFEVSSCTSNTQCPNQVCCPANTYKKGRCVNELAECLTSIPTSVFEWDFSTGYVVNNPDSQESCKTLAAYAGTCQTGSFCPNVPGVCSPYSGGTKRVVANCDFSCASVIGCSGFGSSICSYDANLNKCVKNGDLGKCSLTKVQSFQLGAQTVELTLTCNKDKHWEAKTPTSCPNGWEKGLNNICIDQTSVCDICESSLKCEKVGLEGRCVAAPSCPMGSVCEDNIDIAKPDSCVIVDKPSCDCCCRKDQAAQDCCAPLTCDGACGADKTGNSNLGRCGGCATVGTTVAEHDAACNCVGHTGQYCSITPETPNGICTDCSGLEGLASCSEHNTACCFDAKKTVAPGDDVCRSGSGTTISNNPLSPDFGYCGYFGCFNTSTPPIGDPLLCASTTPVKIGLYKDSFACADGCAKNTPQDTCAAFNKDKDGCLAVGTCCYDNTTEVCKGGEVETSGPDAGKVMCCGCVKDGDCALDPKDVGCGLDACCESRPQITNSLPKNGATNICRNSVLQVTFNQAMDIASFTSNVVLLQEMNYGGNTCPAGTFVYDGEPKFIAKDTSWFINIFNKLKISVSKLFGTFNNQALADLPDPTKLYCSFPGNISGEYIGTSTTLLKFAPKKILSPEAKYFLVIKGDEQLNSQSGVINLSGVGFNGLGLDKVGDFVTADFVEGETLQFNAKSYKNSHILQFKTLSDKDNSKGICAVKEVKVSPVSYLFKTGDDDLDENDIDPANKKFDTKSDKDKVFTAAAYSADRQILQPVTGYFWDWKFSLSDPSVASMDPIVGLGNNKSFISTKDGIADGRTKLKATIDMTRFLDAGSSPDANCTCSDASCSNKCRNAFSIGDNFSGDSSLYVFICNNPWPPVSPDGTWAPWSDNCAGAIGTCINFNYILYYCRDAGQPGTFDDLPLIIDDAIIRGQSNTLVCSSDNSVCPTANQACGPDKNGDSKPDGVCIWNVLKESFFFRETASSAGEIMTAMDKQTSGAVTITWKSAPTAASYNLYYGETGKALSLIRKVQNNATYCHTVGVDNICSIDFTNLKNGQSYSFRVSVVAANTVESSLSYEKTVTPTDKAVPMVPLGFKIEDKNTFIQLSWTANTDDTLFYRVYRGTKAGFYGESFDTNDKATSTTIEKSKLTLGNNYFVISALDTYKNESIKSLEVIFSK